MKKFLYLALSLGLFSFGVAVGHYKLFPFSVLQTLKGTLEHTPLFQLAQVKDQRIISGGQYDVVFLGDSITSSGTWSELFPTKRVANGGIGGNTSEDILRRIDQVIEADPKLVYLMFGINDIMQGKNVNDIFSNYKQVIERLSKSGTKVIVQSTLLSDRYSYNAKVNDLNGLLVKLTSENGITFIDINKKLAPTGFLPSKNSWDGIHLNENAYLKWKEVIAQNLPSDLKTEQPDVGVTM